MAVILTITLKSCCSCDNGGDGDVNNDGGGGGLRKMMCDCCTIYLLVTVALAHISIIGDGVIFENEEALVPFFEKTALLQYWASHFERNRVASNVKLHALLQRMCVRVQLWVSE